MLDFMTIRFFSKSKVFLLLALFFFMATSAVGCRGGSPEAQREASKPVTLEVWGVFDSQKDLASIFDAYTAQHSNVNFRFKKFNILEYEKVLLDALAEDRGPDIFALPNTWLRGYEGKIAYMPESVTLPYQTVQGSLKKEVVTELRTTSLIKPNDLKKKFVDAVYDDVVFETEIETDGKKTQVQKIFGLPFSLDVLALYYNTDMLNSAGISEPAPTWEIFSDHVKKLASFDASGNIITAGAALGTGHNVERSSDILSLLMMQNGTLMMDSRQKNVAFHTKPAGFPRSFPPGEEALIFYTDYANKDNAVYTWNGDEPNSLEAFISGRAAYFFGYSYHRAQIEKRAPGLKFNVAKSPIIEGNPEINFANYWVYSVSKKSKNTAWAWDFLVSGSSADSVRPYLASLRRPTALRALIDEQKQDPEMRPFAEMLLTAKSWYRGRDAQTADKIFREMIDAVAERRALSFDAIDQAAEMIQQTLRD